MPRNSARRIRISVSAGLEGSGASSPVAVNPHRSYSRRAASFMSVTHRHSAPKSRDFAQETAASMSASPTFWPRGTGRTHMDTRSATPSSTYTPASPAGDSTGSV